MVYIRSFIFNSAFYVGTAILVRGDGAGVVVATFWRVISPGFGDGWLKQLLYCWHSPAGIWRQASGQAGDLRGETSIGLGNNYLELVASCPGICIKSELLRLPIIGLFFIRQVAFRLIGRMVCGRCEKCVMRRLNWRAQGALC